MCVTDGETWREWRQAVLWRPLAYSCIIWPTCAHMCMTQPGSGSCPQGRPAPATLSSTLWDLRSEDKMQTLRSQSERVCVCVCDHECRPWTDIRFTQEKKRQRNFISCSSDITKLWETKRSEVKNTTLGWGGGGGVSGSKWENMLTKSGPLSVRHPSTDCIFGTWKRKLYKSSLFSCIYAILSAQTSMLLLDYIITARPLTQIDLS